MGQITITRMKMAFKNCFHKNTSEKYLRSIKRKKMFDLWLEMGGNKYLGSSSTLEDNTLISWDYEMTARPPPHPTPQDAFAQRR